MAKVGHETLSYLVFFEVGQVGQVGQFLNGG